MKRFGGNLDEHIICLKYLYIFSPFRYHAWWDFEKAWKLIAGTWIVCFIFGGSMTAYTAFNYMFVRYEARRIYRWMTIYVLSSLYTASMVISFVAYVYIFTRYEKSLKNQILNLKGDTEEESIMLNQTRKNTRTKWYSKKLTSLNNYFLWLRKTFECSKFHIAFLLILSYLVLTVVPSVARSLHFLLGHRLAYEWTFFYLCSVR